MKWLVLGAALLMAAGQAHAEVEFTPGALAAHLRETAGELRAGQSPSDWRNMPAVWKVRTSEGRYVIAPTGLRRWLRSGGRDRGRIEAATWLTGMADQLDSYRETAQISTYSKRQLESILKRPEFAPTKPPGYLAELQRRIGRFLQRWWERLLRRLPRNSQGGQAVTYCIALLAIAALGYFAYRLWRRRDGRRRDLTLGAGEKEPRGWQLWLEAAEAAAAAGHFRKAIQCAYWTAVTRLQEGGELPEESAYTPRELLRRLHNPGLHESTLRLLTDYLERFWYGQMPATAEDLQTCLRSLEALGCRAA